MVFRYVRHGTEFEPFDERFNTAEPNENCVSVIIHQIVKQDRESGVTLPYTAISGQ